MNMLLAIIVLSFLTAFSLTFFAIPSIISIARAKHLCDEPGERSSHKVSTPSLGGIGIFAGTIFSLVLWTPFNQFANLQYVLCAITIIFLIGAKDDISPMSPRKKLVGQFLASAILLFKSDIQLTSLYGVFGIWDQFHPVFYIVLSLFTVLVIINAFNLIDGINGLAGSVGSLIAVVLGSWFILVGRMDYAILAFSTAGAVVAFLRYNYTPAKIFMGDTGSLLIGLVSAVLIIQFIEINATLPASASYRFENIPAVAIGIMILPLYDTMRVFTTRILRGHSPFHPDRRHIHHLLIDYGFSHMQATGVLFFVNILFITLVFSIHDKVELHLLLLIILGAATMLTYFLHSSVVRKKLKQSTTVSE